MYSTSNEAVQKQVDYINVIKEKDQEIEKLKEEIRILEVKLDGFRNVDILQSNYETVSKDLNESKQQIMKLKLDNSQLSEELKKVKNNYSTQKHISMKLDKELSLTKKELDTSKQNQNQLIINCTQLKVYIFVYYIFIYLLNRINQTQFHMMHLLQQNLKIHLQIV